MKYKTNNLFVLKNYKYKNIIILELEKKISVYTQTKSYISTLHQHVSSIK